MAITFDLQRPRKSQYTAFSPQVEAGAAIETVSGSEKTVFIPFNLTHNPDPIVIADCITANGETTVVNDPGAFSDILPGNPVTGTGIPVSTTVVSVSEDGSEVMLSNAATADGTVSLTFDPGSVTATVFGIHIKMIERGKSSIQPNVKLCSFDGSLGNTVGSLATATKVSNETLQDTIDLNAFALAIQWQQEP